MPIYNNTYNIRYNLLILIINYLITYGKGIEGYIYVTHMDMLRLKQEMRRRSTIFTLALFIFFLLLSLSLSIA